MKLIDKASNLENKRNNVSPNASPEMYKNKASSKRNSISHQRKPVRGRTHSSSSIPPAGESRRASITFKGSPMLTNTISQTLNAKTKSTLLERVIVQTFGEKNKD